METAFAHERRFLADASHELQTPLAILRAELEIALRRPRSREELEEVVRSAQEEANRLGKLAEDLLVVARSDQGALPVEPRRRSMPTTCSRAWPSASSAVPSTRAGSIAIETSADLELRCDPIRIGQALGNLIDNSLRYGAGDDHARCAASGHP